MLVFCYTYLMDSDYKKILIFDLDGVIINSIDLMLKLNQQKFPNSTRNDLEELFTGNIREQIDNLKGTYLSEDNPEKLKQMRAAYTKEKTETVELYPGIRALLTQLKEQGYSLSINTSASTANSYNLLKRLGVYDFFDYIITRDFAQSKVEKFKELARLYSCELSDFIFITDSVGDVLESQEVHIPTVAVTWGIHQEYRFKDFSLVGIAKTVDELKYFIKNH